MAEPKGRIYRPDGQELWKYIVSTAPFVCIQGPVASGKSVASAMRLYKAMTEVPKIRGKRKSRWLITRDTYPNLEESTMKTWLDWFPEDIYGKVTWSAPHVQQFRDVDGVEAEVIFRPFTDDDIASLKSLELTGAWINEAQYYSLKLTAAIYERCGRYPAPGKRFMQLDMNAPPYGHWVPMMRGDAPVPDEMTDGEKMALRKPADWEFYKQPPWFIEKLDPQGAVLEYVLNPEAENIRIATADSPDFVHDMLKGKTKDQIDADLMNRVLILTPGRPVFPMFTRETHVAKVEFEPIDNRTIFVGLDFGRQPAAIFAQEVAGSWRIFDELIGSNMAAEDFAPLVKRRLAKYGSEGRDYKFWGDPSGQDKRGEANNDTAFQIFRANGMDVRAADRGNRRTIRIETATSVFNRLKGCLVSPRCKKLVVALAGGYVYQRKNVSGSPVYSEEPRKDEMSHPVDALLEIFMGGGESKIMLGRTKKAPVTHTLKSADPFYRGERAEVFRR